ncbi:NUDIX hydrolase [Azospirillum melinis]|uniref:NUDIX hydrolase n=1 Tax=Azospirillum melinis TaxID=328839 RepID=A0ABX2KL91_9PROT|nr:NUDIX domain-containing protein [Azospirillum melinis]MBP2307139.1 8-oxo-dGTP pyrophosphatase MutT (NUDIX family) [Azospirillum melinis]NUB04370.1 NUDIX hydrolase [Azospirillum melinis]
MPETAPQSPVPAHPAATLILLRDGPEGLELLVMERHAGLRFAPGATVFPGGRMEAMDHDPHWHRLWRRLRPDGDPPADLAHRVAALRECAEECGVLLSRDPLAPDTLDDLRRALAAGEGFAAALARSGAVPALDRLAPLARWVTPEMLPRRFDTLFYLAPAPEGQQPVCDGGEAVGTLWASPRRLLAEAGAGQRRLVYATRMTLLRLAGCADRTAAMALACPGQGPGQGIPPPIMPRLVETPSGPVLRIPEGCGFSPLETPAEHVRLG